MAYENEDRFENQERSNSGSDSRIADEVLPGKEDLVAQQKAMLEDLKTGKSSGITGEFGKPDFVEAGNKQQDASKEAPNLEDFAKYGLPKEVTKKDVENAFHSDNPEKFHKAAFAYLSQHPKDPFVTIDGKNYALAYNDKEGSVLLVPYDRASKGQPTADGGTQYTLGMPGTESSHKSQYSVYTPGKNGHIEKKTEVVNAPGGQTYPGFNIIVYKNGSLPKGSPTYVPANM